MSLISPTTLLVAGSISITLSPAALVWTIRAVAARAVRPVAATIASSTRGLVGIAGYFKLRSHALDPLFRPRPAGRLRARLRRLQEPRRAPAAREAAGPRPLLRVPLDRDR